MNTESNHRTNLHHAPYFPFYVKEWIVMTQLWSAEQKAAYLDLCAYAWTSPVPCSLPDDDTVLAELSGLGHRWKKNENEARVRSCFERVDGALREPNRLHDLRHTFSVHAAQAGYRSRRFNRFSVTPAPPLPCDTCGTTRARMVQAMLP